MPASEFAWPSNPHQAPIFQVYGTKRKAIAGENAPQAAPQETQDEQVAKRLCTWSESQGAMSAEEEINHNSMTMEDLQHSLSQQQQQQHHQQIQQQMQLHQQQLLQAQQQSQAQGSSHCGPWPAPSEPHQQASPSASLQGNDHIMDLCDETYSTHTMGEDVESAYMNMDSDCAPDPQQYVPRPNHATTDSSIGDLSPTSGRVRCYCKPSWEGMMHLKPYVSDIY